MLALIDGDVLAHLACMNRWETKYHIDKKKSISYVPLDEDGNIVPIEYSKKEEREYLEVAWGNFKSDLKRLLEAVFCDKYLMAVKGEGNFRKDIYPDYKQHRKTSPPRQNTIVPILRQLAVHEKFAHAADGMEADDLIRIWAEELRSKGEDYIVCSIDKDLKCIPGKHYYMRKAKEKMFEVSEEEALKFQYEQILSGDSADGIPGCIGVGPVTARKALAELKTEEEYQRKVVNFYKMYYDDWEDQLIFNGKLVYILKHKDDEFSIDNWSVIQEIRNGT